MGKRKQTLIKEGKNADTGLVRLLISFHWYLDEAFCWCNNVLPHVL